MKRKLFLMFALLCAAAQGAWAQVTFPIVYDDVWDGTTKTKPTFHASYGGKSNVYVINTAAELVYVNSQWDEPCGDVDGKDFYEVNYYLNANLDMNWNKCWTPLGGYSGQKAKFDGEFYGNGHTIRIHIFDTNENYQGLFAHIDYGKVENLHVTGKIECKKSRLVGSIAGQCGEYNQINHIKYCCVSGNVTNNDADVGGIVGCCKQDNNSSYVEHVTFYGTRNSTHSQKNVYFGDNGGYSVIYLYLNDSFQQSELDAAGDNNMYRQAVMYPFAVNINTVGSGSVKASVRKDQWHVVNDITAYFYADWPTQGAGTAESPYLISSTEDWNRFAHNVCCGRTYSGKHVKLTNNIRVSNPAGSDDEESFQGTFDGDGHTLTFNQSDWTRRYIAPFRFVGGTCTIKNLHTEGTITSSGMYATGLIAGTKDGSNITVENCVSSMTLSNTDSDEKTLSGLVGRIEDVMLTIRGCVFNGSLTGSTATGNAGFVSWIDTGCTVTIENCLFAPCLPRPTTSMAIQICVSWPRKPSVWSLSSASARRTVASVAANSGKCTGASSARSTAWAITASTTSSRSTT